jgi:hypothetical protein
MDYYTDKPWTEKPMTQQTLDTTIPGHNKPWTQQTLDTTSPGQYTVKKRSHILLDFLSLNLSDFSSLP